MIVLLAKKYHKVNFLIFSKADVVRDNLPAAWSYFTDAHTSQYPKYNVDQIQ